MSAGDPGLYLVYHKSVSEKGEQRKLVGRFVIHGGNITILEDHNGFLEKIFPTGPMTGRELARMQAWSDGQSPYWDIVSEEDINQGKEPDFVEELNLGGQEWQQPTRE